MISHLAISCLSVFTDSSQVQVKECGMAYPTKRGNGWVIYFMAEVGTFLERFHTFSTSASSSLTMEVLNFSARTA